MKIPALRAVTQALKFSRNKPSKKFTGSDEYWKRRYKSGGNSGAGSYNKLAEFKADILNEFVKSHQINTVIEYGCGDGNQLRAAQYPYYTGFDISPEAVSLCSELYAHDDTKTFKLMDEYTDEQADLSMSLDVVYHLIEDKVYQNYMDRLFSSSRAYVAIYSSNTDEQSENQSPHVKHREFSRWIAENRPQWKLKTHIPNKYPYKGDDKVGSIADFYIYEVGVQHAKAGYR